MKKFRSGSISPHDAFFLQGGILTLLSFLLRAANMGYRAWISRTIGAAGVGLYQLMFSIFMLCITLSTSGVSLAVTRVVTLQLTQHEPHRVRSAVMRCLVYCLGISFSLTAFFFVFAPQFSAVFLGDPAGEAALRLLALGLPFMATCTCLKGYFLAVERSLCTAGGDCLETAGTVFTAVLLFRLSPPHTVFAACARLMLASTVGECAGFLFVLVCFRISIRRRFPAPALPCPGVYKSMCHIALPCTLSAAARNLLSTAENLLIPVGLKKNGSTYTAAMAQYGELSGMAMPMLLFPAAFLSAFSSLLIPRAAKAYAAHDKKAIARFTQKALTCTLLFAGFVTAFFAAFADELSQLFFHSNTATGYLRLFAPLVPLLYLDGVVDALLKGLDQQLHSMGYNFVDSALRVALVFLLLPKYGIRAYIGILFFSTIFNAFLSLRRLLLVTSLRLPIVEVFICPGLCAALAVCCVRLCRFCPMFAALPLWLTFCLELSGSACLYGCLLQFSGIPFLAKTHKKFAQA